MIRHSLYNRNTLSLTPGTTITGFSFDYIKREMLFADHWSEFPEEFTLEGHSTKFIPETGVYLVQAYEPSAIEVPGMVSTRLPCNESSISSIAEHKLIENKNVVHRASHTFHYLPFHIRQPVGVFLGEIMLLSTVDDSQAEPNYLMKILTNHGVKWVVRPTWDY